MRHRDSKERDSHKDSAKETEENRVRVKDRNRQKSR